MTTEKTEFTYDELSPEAQERARDKWREGALDHEWWDSTYDDCKEVGKLLGIQIENIYFSGFSSQGDGACLEGSWSAEDCEPEKCIANYPKDSDLHGIANAFASIKTEWPYASFQVQQWGHYYHENCTTFDVSTGRHISEAVSMRLGGEDIVDVHDSQWLYDDSEYSGRDEMEKFLKETAKDFMRWIYRQLECDHDYQLSDEVIADSIRANECKFDEEGRGL